LADFFTLVRVLAPIVAFLLTFAIVRVLLLPATRDWFLDQPNRRSLHVAPVPRTGGLGIVPGLAVGMALASGAWLASILAVGLMLLSLADDWKSLPASVRLLAHLAAAATFILGALNGLNWVEACLVLLAIGWMTNLYNFMDGADGLAAGMAVFGFGTYAVGAWLGGETSFALVNLSVVGAAAAFLLVNFPPARMFMGDAGSIPLGFLAAVLGLTGWDLSLWPLWFPLVVFAPFVLDASVTLVRRALRGEKPWEAHRSHYYQRRVLLGWSHRRLAMFEYGLMLGTGVAAVIALRSEPSTQATIVAVLALIYIGAGLSVDAYWRGRQEI